MEEQKSFPVRYMVLLSIATGFRIVDTLHKRGTLCYATTIVDAEHICKLLNESEGHRYDL